VRVVIAEDLFLLRDGLTRLLEAHGLEVTAAVDNGTDLLAVLTAGPPDVPDVAVVDVRLPPTFTDEGLRAALAARRAVPGLPVLVLSQYVEQLYAANCWPAATAASVTCSRTGCSTAPSSSTRYGGSPQAGPRWIPR